MKIYLLLLFLTAPTLPYNLLHYDCPVKELKYSIVDV